MPYDGMGNFIDSKTDITTDTLGFGEIGGVGQLIYRLFRFKKYEIKHTEGGAILACPVCRTGYKPEFHNSDDLVGTELLISLYNLALKVNDPSEEKSYVDLIMEWCETVAHPYFVDEINALMGDKEFDFEQDSYFIEKDSIFNVQDFMRDLGRLYQATAFAFALEQMEKGFDDQCFELAKGGRYFDGVPFLEKYKYESNDIHYDADAYAPITPAELLKEMQETKSTIHVNTQDEGFARVPFDDYAELRDKLIDMIPNFHMRLKVNLKKTRVVLAADIHSVFDIAWFTLAKKICEDSMPNLKKAMSTLDQNERPVVLSCLVCGKAFVRKGKANRKLYCGDPECNKRRLALNTRNFRKRQRISQLQTDNDTK